MKVLLGVLAILPLPLFGQAQPPVDQKAIEAAIKKGVDYLKTAVSPVIDTTIHFETDEIPHWTFVHAGVSEDESQFQGPPEGAPRLGVPR